MDDIAAGAFVPFQLQQTAALPVFQQLAEGPKAVIGFVEAGFAPFQGLFDHRTPDLVRFTALGDQRLDGCDDQVDGLLFFVFFDFTDPLLGRRARTRFRGDFFALLGPNGAGKTTIVRMLLGFSFPDEGRISINDVSASNPDARIGVGYLAEQHKIPPHISGHEYLRRSAVCTGLTSSAEISKEIDRVLTICGMHNHAREKSAEYSKGMRQRIGLASAIMNKPKVLILDEPASGLDPLGMREIRMILEGLQQSGVTILLNSHFLSEVEKICQKAAIINFGKVLLNGKISEIVQGEETLEDVFVKHVGGSHAHNL